MCTVVLLTWFSMPCICFQELPERSHTSLCTCFHVSPSAEFESSYGFSGILEVSKSKVETCLTFSWFLEIKHVDLGFASASSSSLFLSWIIFDMTFVFSIERKWLQDNIEKFMMFNKRRRLHISSRVKLPSVNMSASWFLKLTCLIWILGSKLILSNN